MVVMTGEAIKNLCEAKKPLISNAIDLNTQIQQNGVDLTLKSIELFISSGVIDFDNTKRSLPDTMHIKPRNIDDEGFKYFLSQGVYLVTFNEIVAIPNIYMARACPRSSLMRCGATMSTAVWDAGYEGQSQALLTVHNEKGIVLCENARIAQFVLEKLNSNVTNGYNGIYQREGL
jgi:dUTP pyrophosphatase